VIVGRLDPLALDKGSERCGMGEDVGATTGDVAELGTDSALQRCSRVHLLRRRVI
jgi:hypothetical protein